MPLDRSDYKIDIKTTGDTAGVDKVKASLNELGEAASHSSEGVDKLGLSHHQLHTVLERVAPGLAGMARFLTSGFAGAIGVVLIAFNFLNEKLEQFKKLLDDIDTGPGASGSWAEKIRDNAREAAVATALLNDKLHATAVAQETLDKLTDRDIARQKEHAADAKEIGDAEKVLALAKLALAEKLGQVTADQAVKIRLEIDDAAFKRELAAKKAEIQAELSARQKELSDNERREPTLGSAMDRAGASALAAKNAQDKNQAKIEQDKANLKTAQDTAAKDEAVLAAPHHFGDKADTFLKDQAQKNLDQMQGQIGQLTTSIRQETEKQTPLETAASLAKQQFERAKADYESAAKISEETQHTISDLQAKLAGVTAQNDTLQKIHDQTSAVNRTGQNADIANRVASGHGTAGDIAMTDSWHRQSNAAHETGPQAGVDAQNVILQGRNILATVQGQGGRQSPQQMEQVHAILDQIIGFLSSHSQNVQGMGGNLEDLKSRLTALEQNQRNNRWQGQ